ncbi:MAG: archease [Bacteroidetes bacterium]|nr:archease [Bacteroidota bacterium]
MTKEPTKTDPGWRLLEHTADIRMEVRGTSKEEFFLNAARGFTSLLVPEAGGLPDTDIELNLKADNIEELLVDWLRELLFRHETKGFILISADIAEVSATSLRANLAGRTRASEEEPEIEIKAVTYHGLSVQKNDAGYVVTIVFDI